MIGLRWLATGLSLERVETVAERVAAEAAQRVAARRHVRPGARDDRDAPAGGRVSRHVVFIR